MVSAAKAFSAQPPREPLTSFKAIIEDFQWRYVDTKKTDQVIDYCKRAPTLSIAIDRAVRARDVNGKHHNHQSKVDLNARLSLGRWLRSHKGTLNRIAAMEEPENPYERTRFDVLHDYIDECKPYGIGPVTVYDVAVRVGAYLNIEPNKVYMHAGVRQGLRALVDAHKRWVFECPPGDAAFGPGRALRHMHTVAKMERIPIAVFPHPLNRLKADDVEDILCTYREVFQTWHS